MSPFPARGRLLCVALMATGLACSSGGDDTTTPTGGFSIAVSPGALSVQQGGSGQVSVTLTRTGGFSGTVNFSVQGAPSGVTGAVSGAGSGTSSTGTVTISVGAGVAPGVYNMTLRASATGLADRTAAVALTVTAAGGFSITTTLAGVTIVQGGTGTGSVTLTRTGGFAGAVALSVTGVPAGVTASFDPAEIPGGATGADLDFTVGAAVTAGAYPLVITGSSAGLPDATANFLLTIAQGSGSLTLTANPAVLEIQQGATGQTTLTVARAGGFNGPVALALTGTSAGITATFDPAVIPAGETTSEVTISIPGIPAAPVAPTDGPAGTPLGDYPLVFTASAPGLQDATANVIVGVSPAPGGSFTMGIAPAAASVQAGTSTQATLTVTRSAPFVGGVTFQVSGSPANVFVSFAPVSIAAGGTTTQVTFTTTTAAAPGVYPITITGIGDGVNVPDAATGFTLTITSPPSPSDIVFEFCDPATAPVWFAYQDGVTVEPWMVLAPSTGHTYNVPISGTGGVAWVEPDGGGGFTTRVTYANRSQLVRIGAGQCARSSGKTVTGSVAGLGAADNALVSLGTSGTAASFANPGFTLRNVPPGPRTLIGSRAAFNLGTLTTAVDRIILRRNQDFPNGAVVPVLDFGAEGFAPVFHPLTVNNLMGWVAAASTQYFTDNGGSAGTLFSGGATSFPAIPGAQLQAGDFHYVVVNATPSLITTSPFRSAGRFFMQPGPQTIELGPLLATPTVTSVAGGDYARLSVTGTVQDDYNRLLQLSYAQAGRGAILQVTGSPFATGGGPIYAATFPNFSGLPGWLDAWMPARGAATSYSLFLMGWEEDGDLFALPVEGELVLSAGQGGGITP